VFDVGEGCHWGGFGVGVVVGDGGVFGGGCVYYEWLEMGLYW